MSKLAMQEKSRKNIDFNPFWGKQKSWTIRNYD
jgi:hypothetical protein